MLSRAANPDADAAVNAHAFEVLPEVQADADGLGEDVRLAIADIVVALHENPWQGEPMDDRWPDVLAGCRAIRFDTSAWNGEPRYRFIYRNDRREGAAGATLVLAIGPRHATVAYAQAVGRLIRREAAKHSPGARSLPRSL
jgi:hypothetical protein